MTHPNRREERARSWLTGVTKNIFLALLILAGGLIAALELFPDGWQANIFHLLWLLLGCASGVAIFIFASTISRKQFKEMIDWVDSPTGGVPGDSSFPSSGSPRQNDKQK